MGNRAYDTGRVLFVLLAVAAILTSVYEVTFEEWDAYAFGAQALPRIANGGPMGVGASPLVGRVSRCRCAVL